MFISAGRFKLNSITSLPALMRTYQHTKGYWRLSPGFTQSKFHLDSDLSFWMMNAWTSADAFNDFQITSPQQTFRVQLKEHCQEACFTHWTSPFEELPSWEDIRKALKFKGVFSFQKSSCSNRSSLFLKPSPLYKQLFQASNQS